MKRGCKHLPCGTVETSQIADPNYIGNGLKVSGKFSQSLGKMLRVKQPLSMAYLPQAKGQTQTTKQVLERYLQTLVHYHRNDLCQLLPLAEHVYNNSATNAYKMTLFWAYYSFNPQTGCKKRRGSHGWGHNI